MKYIFLANIYAYNSRKLKLVLLPDLMFLLSLVTPTYPIFGKSADKSADKTRKTRVA